MGGKSFNKGPTSTLPAAPGATVQDVLKWNDMGRSEAGCKACRMRQPLLPQGGQAGATRNPKAEKH